MKKQARGSSTTKVRPKTARQRLWAIQVCPTETERVMTIIVMAPTVRLALEVAERRYPNRFCEGSRGHALEADHVAIAADGTFDVIKAGAWWGTGYLPDLRRSKVNKAN